LLASVDVGYRGDDGWAACVLFEDWKDALPVRSLVTHVENVAPYQSGQFYLRELPCLLAVLEAAAQPLSTVVVDGYVWLGQDRRPGLGARLYEALGRKSAVIGVAKTPFHDTPAAEVLRGASHRPLWVTAAGMECQEAAEHIHEMHGTYRIPSLLKEADRLAHQAGEVSRS
jgi:deoxyribonuclease V